MSDGLIAPVNAPDGGAVSTGVQPGVTGPVVLASLVIVGGTSSQILVYNGTPAPGNLIGSWTNAAGTDPLGDPVLKDLTVYNPGTTAYVNITSSGASAGNTGILFAAPGATHITENSQISGQAVNAGAVNEYELLQLTSGIAGAGAQSADMTLASTSADSSIAALIYQTIAGTRLTQLSLAQFQVRVPIASSAGSPSNPTLITTDAWNAVSLAAGWSTLGGFPVPSYRLLPDGNVQITGVATHAAFAVNTALSASALPAAYRPATEQFIAVSQPGSAGLQIDTSGNLTAITNVNTGTAAFNGTYPVNL